MSEAINYLHKVGPALWLIAADPTVADGDGWTFVGPTHGEATVAPNAEYSVQGNDLLGVVGMKGATHYLGARPEVRAPLLDESKDLLKTLLQEALVQADGAGSAVGFKAGMQKITEQWLVGVPIDEAADGVAAENAIWIPAMHVSDFGQFTRALPQSGNTPTSNPRQTVFSGVYSEEVKSGGEALPDGARIMWIGPPSDWGLSSILLPDLTTYLPG